MGKDSDAGRDWGQEEKGTTEDEMAGWHRRLDECEFEWTPGVWEFVMDREAWSATNHGITKSRTWLSDWTELNWTDWNCNSGRFLIFWSSYIVKYLFLHLMSIFFSVSYFPCDVLWTLSRARSLCVYIWECLRLLQKNRNLTGGIMIVFRKLQIH